MADGFDSRVGPRTNRATKATVKRLEISKRVSSHRSILLAMREYGKSRPVVKMGDLHHNLLSFLFGSVPLRMCESLQGHGRQTILLSHHVR